jgi:hydroxyacylglutathione hydrolase
MYIEQIYTGCLSQASYYIESNGEAAIVDPMRDIDIYLELAKKRNSEIKYVLNTHFHADFVSGHLDLSRATGAIIIYGPGADPDYKVQIIEDYKTFRLGNIKIQLLHTPGHTIESSCYLLYDEDDQATTLFSGDTLFIGDVGRPDLLSGNLSKEELAAKLFNSLQVKIKSLPGSVIVYPGHGAGSACGKNIGKERWSTIADQKKHNYALKDISQEEFIKIVCSDQPLIPAHFFKDATINKVGYTNLEIVIERSLKALSKNEIEKAIANDTIIIDTRSASLFGEEFIKGAINIGLDGQFASWFGTLIDFEKPVVIIADKDKEKEVIIRLARIGYEKVIGYFENDLSDLKTDSVGTINIDDMLIEFANTSFKYLDVRKKSEVEKSKVRHSLNIPLEELYSKIPSLNKDEIYMVYCVSGYRSMIAASILKKHGFQSVYSIKGGINGINDLMPLLVEIPKEIEI